MGGPARWAEWVHEMEVRQQVRIGNKRDILRKAHLFFYKILVFQNPATH